MFQIKGPILALMDLSDQMNKSGCKDLMNECIASRPKAVVC